MCQKRASTTMSLTTDRMLHTLLSATALLLAIGLLTGCGAIQPGTPGHEPPLANRYNPVSGEVNSSGK